MAPPTTVLEAGAPTTAGYTVLVAVGNPTHAEQLLRTAGDLARQHDGSVHVVSVVAKDQASPFGVFDDETIGSEFAGDSHAALDRAVSAGRDCDVTVGGRVVVARSIPRGVIETAAAVDADAILVGWSGRARRSDAVLGTNVDAIIERAPHDVFVERVGTTADGVDSVLVPVAGGPHASLAARAGHAIATANDARLTLLSVARGDTDRATARERIRSTLEDLAAATGREMAGQAGDPGGAVPDPAAAFDVEVVTDIATSENVVDAIATAALDHDVVLLGATRSGHHRARLVGSIPQAVADRTDRTIVLARRWTGPSRLTRIFSRITWS